MQGRIRLDEPRHAKLAVAQADAAKWWKALSVVGSPQWLPTRPPAVVLLLAGAFALAMSSGIFAATAAHGAGPGHVPDHERDATGAFNSKSLTSLDFEDSGDAGVAAEPTPVCPGSVGAAPDADCDHVKIVGNTYIDTDRNGRYESHRGDYRLPNARVGLLDAATGAPLGEAVTNKDGYYRFAGLPAGPTYRVEVAYFEHYRPTTPIHRDLELRDFSTYWCCSARADFGFYPDRAPAPTVPPPPPPGVVGGPVPAPPCCEIPYGRQIHLPALNYEANENVCSSIVEVQNVGAWPSKAMLLVWGAPGYCPPQCTGPLKVECSGLLMPGTAWHFLGSQLPSGAKSGMVFSAPALSIEHDAGAPGGPLPPGVPPSPGGDVFADLLCEALYREVVGDCNAFRRFKKAFNEYGVWATTSYAFDFGRYPGASMAAEVVRKCPGDASPMTDVAGGYMGLADEQLGAFDPLYGGFAFFVPLVYADEGGYTSWLYIQNGGFECSSVELWFKAQDDCNRPRVCDVATLAPGEAFQFDAATCVGPGFVGSAWVRGSQPLSIVSDIIGHDVLMTYTGTPSELAYGYEGEASFTTGSRVAYGPLTFSEHQGWDSLVQVQNLSPVTNAKVKVYFLDRSGGVIQTLVDWICPGGSQGYFLPIVADMPGNWVGAVRAESQEWFAPGVPTVRAPNIAGVVSLIKYADATRAAPLEAMAYGLFPEQRAFDWQVGSGPGGLWSGVGRIAIPSLMKDLARTGLTTEIAISNLVPVPGFTDFIIYVYDQNGLVDSLCQKLGERQVEHIDLAGGMAFLPAGFKGSAVISAVYWEHLVFEGGPSAVRNVLGLAAVKLERVGSVLGADVPGDESAASQGFPIVGPFAFAGLPIACPGVPSRAPCCGPPGGPTPPAGPPTPLPPGGPLPPAPPVP